MYVVEYDGGCYRWASMPMSLLLLSTRDVACSVVGRWTTSTSMEAAFAEIRRVPIIGRKSFVV